MQNELTFFSQSDTTIEKTQSSFKTSAAVIVTFIALSTSSQIIAVSQTGYKFNKANVENAHDSTELFYKEGLLDSHVHYSENVSQSAEDYHVITEVKPMKNAAYSNLISYVHFMNTIGWIIGIGLLLVGFFIFKLPVISSIFISMGGFILPILTRISGVHKYARK